MSKPVIEIVAAESAGPAWAEALRSHASSPCTLRLVTGAPPDGESGARAADYLRLLRERMGPRGWDHDEIGRALKEPLIAAVARLLRGEASALIAVQEAAAVRAAWRWLEPAPHCSLARVQLGRLAAEPSPAFAWFENALDASAAAALASAAEWLGAGLSRAVKPVVVSFAGGKNPQRGQIEAAMQTLRARAAAAAAPSASPESLELYSPLFYAAGRLQAGRLLAEVLHRIAKPAERTTQPLLLLWVPQLDSAEFAAALAADGGALSGSLLAGAERPVASLAPGASAGAIELTLTALCALAKPRD